MKISDDIQNIVKRMGGKKSSYRGEVLWVLKINDFVIHMEPWIKELSSKYCLGLNCAISHVHFEVLANRIMGEKPHDFVSLKWFPKDAEVKVEGEIEKAFKLLIQEAIDEVGLINIESLIEEFKNNRPDRPSLPQICHLAALAWTGDYATLEDYERIFAAGYRMNFVPVVTIEMIFKAEQIAKQRF